MIPTILLTGFLGAGKTTLLNRLIKYYKSKRTVLLINEFGKVGIDGTMLIDGNYEKVELNRGSLFCICVRTDFISEVEKIATQIKPDLLIIEATGLADTSEMEKMLALPNLKEFIQLKLCICLVDCLSFLKIKDNLKAPVSQIKSADLILVNKVDLVSPAITAKIKNEIKNITSIPSIILTSFADFPLKKLDNIIRPDNNIPGMPGDGRPDQLFSITLEGEGCFTKTNWNKFKVLIRPNLMRLKGFVLIENKSYYVDATMDQWNMKENVKTSEQMNKLVYIGQDFNQQKIEEAFSRRTITG